MDNNTNPLPEKRIDIRTTRYSAFLKRMVVYLQNCDDAAICADGERFEKENFSRFVVQYCTNRELRQLHTIEFYQNGREILHFISDGNIYIDADYSLCELMDELMQERLIRCRVYTAATDTIRKKIGNFTYFFVTIAIVVLMIPVFLVLSPVIILFLFIQHTGEAIKKD